MKDIKFKLRMLPAMVFTGLVMLLMGIRQSEITIDNNPNLPVFNPDNSWDIFCIIKSDAIVFISLWALVTLLYLMIIGQIKIKRTLLYIPMAGYLICVIISFLLSDYKDVAWLGFPGHYEGTKVIICYIFMLFYIINVVDDKTDFVFVISSALICTFFECLLGLSQLLGYDFLLSDFFSFLVRGGDFSMDAVFLKEQVYQTVYNMNYVFWYLAFIFPIVCLFLIKGIYDISNSTDLKVNNYKTKRVKIIVAALIVLLILIILNLAGSVSLGGVLGLLTAFVCFLLLFLNKKWLKIIIGLSAAILMCVVLFIVYRNGITLSPTLDYIITDDDSVTLSIDGNELTATNIPDIDELTITDGDGKALTVFCFEGEEGLYQIEDRFKKGEDKSVPKLNGKVTFSPDEYQGEKYITFYIKRDSFTFIFSDEGVKYINPYNAFVDQDKVPSFGFLGHLRAGSSRAYIWSRTIPLLKERIIYGYGADVFPLIFPQDDYAGKFSIAASLAMITDKPHNMYLQMALGSGVISCIFYLVFIALFIVMAVKSKDVLLMSVAASVSGFMVAGVFNDSNLCIMPLFYGILGAASGLLINKRRGIL